MGGAHGVTAGGGIAGSAAGASAAIGCAIGEAKGNGAVADSISGTAALNATAASGAGKTEGTIGEVAGKIGEAGAGRTEGAATAAGRSASHAGRPSAVSASAIRCEAFRSATASSRKCGAPASPTRVPLPASACESSAGPPMRLVSSAESNLGSAGISWRTADAACGCLPAATSSSCHPRFSASGRGLFCASSRAWRARSASVRCRICARISSRDALKSRYFAPCRLAHE